MEALAAVEVAELQRMAALVEAEVAGQGMKWEEELAVEEVHLIQAAVVLVLRCLAGEVEEQGEQSFRSVPGLEVEVVAAFLQLQHLRLGRRSPSEGAAEDHLSVQAEEAALKERACPRKAVVR